MTLFRLAPATWKWLNAACAALLAVLMMSDVGHAIRPMLADGMQGSLGVELDDEFSRHAAPPGSHFLHIQAFDQQSPLAAAGAQVGDTLRFDRHLDRWRRFAIGEQIGLTLYRDGAAHHVQVTATGTPVPFADSFEYWGRVLLGLVSLLFCLMVGFKQGDQQNYRFLARTFLGTAALFFVNFHYSPPDFTLQAGKFAALGLMPLLWYWCVSFMLSWQPYHMGPLRHWLTRLRPLFRILCFATSGYAIWWSLGGESPLLGLFIMLCAGGGILLTMSSLAEGWAQSSGEIRQRHLWLIASFAIGAIPGTIVWIPAADWAIKGMRVAILAAVTGNLLMYCGLAYAVLRHRIFHFEFAVNRAMVYSVVSVLLLCTVGLLEFLSKSLLKGGEHAHKSLLIDAGIALGVYLVFHQLHGRIEKWVEKIFFFKWHDNEHKLRHYVKQAAHFTEVEPLLSSFRTAIDRFTAQAGCAIYLRQASGDYALVGGTMHSAPEEIDPNHELAVALRADMAPTPLEHFQRRLPGELVLPMSHRGTLNGFVLVASKSSLESYRPDEIEVMAFAAQQIGLDIHALRVEALEGEVRALELQAEQQRRELEIMAGRRKNARSLGMAPHDLQSST
jgi:hypothetical protein